MTSVFNRTRGKIVASIMVALVLLFSATLAVIFLSEYYENRKTSLSMLKQYMDLYSLDALPGTTDAMPPDMDGEGLPPDLAGGPNLMNQFQLYTFYSVSFANSDANEVLAIDTGMNQIYKEQALIDISRKVIESGREKGSKGSLLYQVEERDGYTFVAFIDNTLAINSLSSLAKHTLIIGSMMLVILFFISVLISKWIIKPLEENDRRQKQFISDAGHELKTPISVISTNAELLSRQIDNNEWLENICYENERMGNLVTELLDLSRAENAKVQMEHIDLSRLVIGESLPFESVAFEKQLTINSDIEDNIQINGNSSQLSQLVSILLDNAIKHADGGKEIDLKLKKQGHNAIISVENSGKEIPKESRERLFERFYRVDDVRNSESHHYGLGLAIAKAITDSHKGTISVNCQNGKVIFTVSLPI